MRNIIIIFIAFITSCCSTKVVAQPAPITDTLQWLKVNIEQQNGYFQNKPLSVMLDTLQIYGLTGKFVDYKIPHISDDQPGHTYPKDTIKTTSLVIYLEKYYGTNKRFDHDSNPNINTHIKWIAIEFAQPVPYPNPKHIIRSSAWTTVENLCKNYIVYSVKVGEY